MRVQYRTRIITAKRAEFEQAHVGTVRGYSSYSDFFALEPIFITLLQSCKEPIHFATFPEPHIPVDPSDNEKTML